MRTISGDQQRIYFACHLKRWFQIRNYIYIYLGRSELSVNWNYRVLVKVVRNHILIVIYIKFRWRWEDNRYWCKISFLDEFEKYTCLKPTFLKFYVCINVRGIRTGITYSKNNKNCLLLCPNYSIVVLFVNKGSIFFYLSVFLELHRFLSVLKKEEVFYLDVYFLLPQDPKDILYSIISL